ncbi:MAG: FxsA family protein [Magnetococcus sp. DMHC-8]
MNVVTKILLFLGVLLSSEIYLIGQVMDALGVLVTLLILVTTVVLGGRLVKLAGMVTLRNMAGKLQAGGPIGLELVEGGVLLAAGFLFVFPGFLSDILAVLLLLPPVRRLAVMWLAGALSQRDLSGHAGSARAEYTIIHGEARQEADVPADPSVLRLPSPDARQDPVGADRPGQEGDDHRRTSR